MKLVLFQDPLEKGRKPLPEGTVRDYGGMKFQKKGGKWIYYAGSGQPAAEEVPVEEPVAEKTDELTWDAVSVPTRAYLEQEIRKYAEEDFPGGFPDDIVKTMADLGIGYDQKYGGGKNAVLSELKDIAQGKREGWQELSDKLHVLWGGKQFSRELSTSDCMAWSNLYHYYSGMISAAYLDDTTFDGKLVVHHTYPQKEGLSVTFNSNVGGLPALLVPWEQMESFYHAYYSQEDAKRWLMRWKKHDAYRKWQVSGGDPQVRAEVEKFKEEVGIEIDADTTSFWSERDKLGHGSGKLQLKPQYIRTLRELFRDLGGIIDFKSYTPPDGKALHVRVTGVGKKYRGFYSPRTCSINISPSAPGTITHEIGHYLFDRGGFELEKEFMVWAEKAGLLKKIEHATSDETYSPEKLEQHIVDTVGQYIRNFDEYIAEFPSIGAVFNNQTAIDGLHDYLTAVGWRVWDDPNCLPKKSLMSRLPKMTDVEFIRNLRAHHLRGMLEDRDENTLTNNLLAFKHAYENLNEEDKTVFDVFSDGFMGRVTRRTSLLSDNFYQKNKEYWRQPTEIFARVFRCYCTYKAGKLMTDSDTKGFLGWGFAAVDPSDMMMQMEHENLKAMYQKHFGEGLVKSLEFRAKKSVEMTSTR